MNTVLIKLNNPIRTPILSIHQRKVASCCECTTSSTTTNIRLGMVMRKRRYSNYTFTNHTRIIKTCNVSFSTDAHDDDGTTTIHYNEEVTTAAGTAAEEQEQEQPPTDKIAANPFTENSNELVKEIADNIRQTVRNYTSKHKLNLVGITTSRLYQQQHHYNNRKMSIDEGIESYSDSVSKSCLDDGINYELWRVAGGSYDTIVHQVDNLIRRANTMPDVHGVLVYYPLLSNKPEILGSWWDGNDQNNNENDDRTTSTPTTKWNLEQQQYNIEKGRYEEKLHYYQQCIPGLLYKTRDGHYRNKINYQRDVEGLSAYHRLRMNERIHHHHHHHHHNGRKSNTSSISANTTDGIIFPCTPMAVMKIIQRSLVEKAKYKQKKQNQECCLLGDMTITIINRSETFGRPLASMLAYEGANVFSIDESSILLYNQGKVKRINIHTSSSSSSSSGREMDIQECVMKSNILVTAVPSPTYEVPTSWIQPDTIVINVASEPNINEEELSTVPGVTYFPQVGKVTVSLLEYNLMTLHQYYQ